jgi:hypothetical protein
MPRPNPLLSPRAYHERRAYVAVYVITSREEKRELKICQDKKNPALRGVAEYGAGVMLRAACAFA